MQPSGLNNTIGCPISKGALHGLDNGGGVLFAMRHNRTAYAKCRTLGYWDSVDRLLYNSTFRLYNKARTTASIRYLYRKFQLGAYVVDRFAVKSRHAACFKMRHLLP